MSSGEIGQTRISTPGNHPDETFLLEADDGFVDGRPTYAELGGDLLLGTLVARREDVLPDRFLQRLVGLVHERRPVRRG